ncbi:hypothetical protein CcrC1_gp189 [Caulobacter phage C1]|nr:hypothetical protein CcrC1_gp189 [Caulobacter phage C1]UTU08418.1 hypothetical protein CcrC2_gp190 [Caulobacter phage C2]UTU08935.1 hypothetical protein CcrJ4_gp184 [Caulobacter phage J4]UTU09491.1 hypothetical protein CcrBL47_gp205 [Caulobacter phage BL47]UTU10051.1 hypothetical protein CcrRB23_gp189 [Caulobacter phage RB23]WGN97086.1 hypothetical protein [Bertelyvirus sp.]
MSTRIPEAVLTIHDDLGQPGRVLFSLDLDMEEHPDSEKVPYCDVVALSLFNLARRQSEAFTETYLSVLGCMGELNDALEAGADAEALAAIRAKWGIELSA